MREISSLLLRSTHTAPLLYFQQAGWGPGRRVKLKRSPRLEDVREPQSGIVIKLKNWGKESKIDLVTTMSLLDVLQHVNYRFYCFHEKI